MVMFSFCCSTARLTWRMHRRWWRRRSAIRVAAISICTSCCAMTLEHQILQSFSISNSLNGHELRAIAKIGVATLQNDICLQDDTEPSCPWSAFFCLSVDGHDSCLAPKKVWYHSSLMNTIALFDNFLSTHRLVN